MKVLLTDGRTSVIGVARLLLLAIILISISGSNLGQTTTLRRSQAPGQKNQKVHPRTPANELPSESSPETAQKEIETLKIDTNLVIVPVIATDINGLYIPNLKQDEFEIYEDDVKQEIRNFGTVSVPFHVVLMLDTSASTKEKLGSIQQAATAFVEQLQSADRVKVISFSDSVQELNEFTNDRASLRSAILKTRSGEGTKLYDAFELALSSIRRIPGRKAIVLFSDGVDWHSDSASLDGTLRGLDEEGVIVYPIRYNTREETERIARQQAQEQVPVLPTIGVIRTPPGTTAPTFPSDDPSSVPTVGSRSKTGPFGLPMPDEILRRRRESDRDRDGMPRTDRLPPDTNPGPRDSTGWPDSRNEPATSSSRRRRDEDSISMMLDNLYATADGYLKQLAEKSGGRLVRADLLVLLPEAFAQIAAELRTQYSLGYYPTNKTRNEQYRRIKVISTRKNVIIRARPGYRSTSGA